MKGTRTFKPQSVVYRLSRACRRDGEGMGMLLVVAVVVDLYMVTEHEADQLRHNTEHMTRQQEAIIGPYIWSSIVPSRTPLPYWELIGWIVRAWTCCLWG